MQFWFGSDIPVPVRQLTQADLSVFDLNPEGGVAMTTLQQDAIEAAGPGGMIYQCDVVPSAVLQRNHRDFTVANFYDPLQRLVFGAPDFQRVLISRYYANRKGDVQAKKDLMRQLLGFGMLGAALDFVFAEFYVSKRRQFCVDVVTYLHFDGRFAKVNATNLGRLSPDHPEHVPALDQVQIQHKKVSATIWNLGCVKVQKQIQLNV